MRSDGTAMFLGYKQERERCLNELGSFFRGKAEKHLRITEGPLEMGLERFSVVISRGFSAGVGRRCCQMKPLAHLSPAPLPP